MGNIEMCLQQQTPFSSELEVYGHIKNSQTRALLSILDAAKIQYKFIKVEAPKVKQENNK